MRMFGFKSIDIENDSKERFILAFAFTLLALIALFICFALHINNPFWAAISVFALSATSSTPILYKFWRRFVGTVVGAILAVIFVLLFANGGFFALILLICLSAVIFYFSKRLSENYLLLFIAVHLVFLGSAMIIDPSISYSLVEERILTNSIGSALITLFTLIVFQLNGYKKPIIKPYQKSEALYYAINISLSTFFAILIWLAFNIPGGVINIAITIIVIAEINYDQILIKSANRFFGCIIGVICGLSALILSSYSLVLLFIIFVITCTCFIYYHLHHPKHGYAGLQAAVAFSITAFPTLYPATSFVDGLYRAIGIFLGICIVSVIHFIHVHIIRKIIGN